MSRWSNVSWVVQSSVSLSKTAWGWFVCFLFSFCFIQNILWDEQNIAYLSSVIFFYCTLHYNNLKHDSLFVSQDMCLFTNLFGNIWGRFSFKICYTIISASLLLITSGRKSLTIPRLMIYLHVWTTEFRTL